MSERVIVDTSAYYALVDADDVRHEAAAKTADYLARSGASLYTTNFVLAETHALILARINRDVAYRTLELLRQSTTRIVRVASKDEQAALALLGEQRDKEYSLTDALSFVVAARLHIRHAWSYDHHFQQAGLLHV